MIVGEENVISERGPVEEADLHETALLKASFQGYQGPLPLPQHLREYDEIVPGLAKTIATEMQEEARHRREIESTVVKTSARNHLLAPIYGNIILLIAVGSVLLSIYLGQTSIAWLFGVATVIGAIGLLVRRMRQSDQSADRQEFLVPTSIANNSIPDEGESKN